MAEIMTVAKEALRARGFQDASDLSADSVLGNVDQTYIIEHEDEVPTWRPRDFSTEETPVGKPYKWRGQVYKLWQRHDATGNETWSPDQAVAMWDVCHTTDPARAKEYTAPQGTRGLWQEGECCAQGGHVWRCLENDNAYGPQEMPSRWDDLGEREV